MSDVLTQQFSYSNGSVSFVHQKSRVTIRMKMKEGYFDLLSDVAKIEKLMGQIANKMQAAQIDSIDLCNFLFKGIGINNLSQIDTLSIEKQSESLVQKYRQYFALSRNVKNYYMYCQMRLNEHAYEVEYNCRIPMQEVRKNKDGRYILTTYKDSSKHRAEIQRFEKNAITMIENFEKKVQEFLKQYC